MPDAYLARIEALLERIADAVDPQPAERTVDLTHSGGLIGTTFYSDDPEPAQTCKCGHVDVGDSWFDRSLCVADVMHQRCAECSASLDPCACEDDAPEPDPLDENDHRDRFDRDGDRWFWVGDKHWHCEDEPAGRACTWPCGTSLTWFDVRWGPLTFAPESDA